MVTSEYLNTEHNKQLSVFIKLLCNLQARYRFMLWHVKLNMDQQGKRFLDMLASGVLLILFSPLYFVAILAVKTSSSGPIFFRQTRVGQRGKEFTMYKFRSMYGDAEARKAELMQFNETEGLTFKMRHDPRITPVGRLFRRFSIDELPQIYNVFKGDMSLVGPRPPVPSEVAEYSLTQRRRLEVTPGITCIWQVSGRSDIPFEKQVEMDIEYVQTRSFSKDIELLLRTIPAVISGKGAY